MGKALLVIVLGAGLVLAKQLYSATEHENRTTRNQAAYQEEVIAREIAHSAFNVGMGEVRAYGENVMAGVASLNGADNEGRSGDYDSGRFTGGSYEVRADLTSGHSVRVVATGRYGDAEYTMHDEYRIPVLTARRDGLVEVSFLQSMAGYCSAVFYREYTLDTPEGTIPEAIMLFAPDNRDRRTARPTQTIWVEAGTQMNFFIAVDKNCSERVPTSYDECEVREYGQTYVFNPGDFDYIHYALDVEAGSLDQATEEIWGVVEQHPDDRQRWRIGWEDIHNTSWDRPDSEDPTHSLQALKMFGYDGVGWPDQDTWLYRLLRDYGNRPDFSDQVIEINVIAATDPEFYSKQEAARAEQAACGEDVDEQVTTEPASPVPPTVPAGEDDIEYGPEPGDDGYTSEELTDFACSCTNNGAKDHKRAVLHRPPGNEANEHVICISVNAVDTHLNQHNDVFPTCEEGKKVKQNKNK